MYYSLILAQWFKQKLRDGSFKESVIFKNRPFSGGTIPKIDSGDLTNLVAKQPYDKQDYFKQYQKSFKDGEYNLQEPAYTPMGQSIRRYMSGGMNWENLTFSPIMPASGKPLLFRKYFPYLVSLLVTFNFVPGVEAVTISKVYAPNNYSLGYKGVVEDEKTLEDLLRNILGQYGIHNLSASEKILSDIYKENPHLGQDPLRPGTSVRITKLIESILTGIFLSECKIISKGSITVAGRLHEVYLVTKNGGIPFKPVALTLGGTIFINEKNVVKQSEIIVGELYKGLPPKIKREDIHRIIVEMTTVHEKMHLLLKRWLEEGLELSPLLISELQKLGELTQEEKNNIIQELSAYLVEIWYYSRVPSIKYEKSEDYEEFCKYAIRAKLNTLNEELDLLRVSEIIGSMGFISEEMVRKLPLEQIQEAVGIAFEGLFGQEIANDLGNGTGSTNGSSEYDGVGQKGGSKSDGMVKISLNPALFPRIRDDVRKETQYLDFKTLNEVLKHLGLEGNKDMVIRLKKREGAQQQYSGKLLPERVEILLGDEIIINPIKDRTGSSPLLGKALVQSPPAKETRSKSNYPMQEIRDALKLILRNNRNLQLINDSFRENEDIMDFCNQIIKVVKEGKKVKVSFVSAELSDKFGKEKELEAYDLGDLENSIGEEIGHHNLDGVDIYINNINIQDLLSNKPLKPGTEITIKSKATSSPMATAGQKQKDVGGIAFNALPIRTESAASSALGSFPGVKAFQGDIEAEWTQIQAVFNAGIRPSIDRISRYSLAAAAGPLAEEKIDQVRGMLADILRSEEEDAKLPATEPALKNLITALES